METCIYNNKHYGKRILSSLDPVAQDQACLDLIYQSNDPGRNHFLKRVELRHGVHTIEAAAEMGYGTREYDLIQVDLRHTKVLDSAVTVQIIRTVTVVIGFATLQTSFTGFAVKVVVKQFCKSPIKQSF